MSDILGGTQSGLLKPHLCGQVFHAVGTSAQVPTDADGEEPTDLHIVPPAETVLEEAARITSEDRQREYGPPEENHARTAGLWSAYLGIDITPRMVCWLNVLQKASRDRHKPKRDNVVDGVGFLANTERLD